MPVSTYFVFIELEYIRSSSLKFSAVQVVLMNGVVMCPSAPAQTADLFFVDMTLAIEQASHSRYVRRRISAVVSSWSKMLIKSGFVGE